MELPKLFIERFYAIYPKIADELLKTFKTPKAVSFRVNSLKTDVKSVLDELKIDGLYPKPVLWYSKAFTISYQYRDRLTHSKAFENGKIYIQSLSSMIAPLILKPEPGEVVLDLTAAPGGKSLMMAAQMKNCGWLSAVEPKKDRFFKLKANLKKGGVTIAHTYMTDGRTVGVKCLSMFDRVMLDAPCSTEARFRSFKPKTFSYWSERKIKEMSKLQQRLMESAIKSLKPKGKLLYATCSFAPEENEAVVDKALKKHPELKVLNIKLPIENVVSGLTKWREKSFCEEVSKSVRILPTETMDGFFLCLLQKC